MLAVVLFELGHPERARASADAAVAHAESLNHANTLGYALTYGVLTLHSCLRDAPAVAQAAERLKTVAETFGMSLWLAYARVFQGWALAMQDRAAEGLRSMRQGLDALEATGTMLHRAQGLGMLAQALHAAGALADALHAIDEALALAQRQHELWIEPELYRIKGAVLQEQDATAAAHCFERAIAVARERQTRSWELRATTSLTQLWAEQGEGNKGYDLLAPIYGWFTEGFDTPDLKDAKALLDALR
jgi:predicted ATPase